MLRRLVAMRDGIVERTASAGAVAATLDGTACDGATAVQVPR